jgi:putative ABC transport system substrate-binding protein
MMTRGRVLAAALCAVLAAPVVAEERQAKKLPRVGWLQNQSSSFPAYEGFREGLRQLGYVEGQNIAIETRTANGQLDRLPELAGELAGLKVDILYVAAEQGLRAAKQVTKTIPIVVVACDPIDSLIASLARPGGDATGLTCISSELAGKRLQLLKDLVPGVSRVAVLYNPDDANKAPEYRLLQEAARALNVTVQPFEAEQAGQIDLAFARIAQANDQALVILADALMNFNAKRIGDLALQYRLPAMYGFREFPEGGGLISYGASLREEFRSGARYVDKILKGAKPGELPVEQPTKFELVINLKTAKALGLNIPPALLARADEVIE